MRNLYVIVVKCEKPYTRGVLYIQQCTHEGTKCILPLEVASHVSSFEVVTVKRNCM